MESLLGLVSVVQQCRFKFRFLQLPAAKFTQCAPPFFQINRNSKAYNQGVQVGDQVVKIGGRKVSELMHNEALQLIRDANTQLVLELHRSVGVPASLLRVSSVLGM